jgi:hypothetical protein
MAGRLPLAIRLAGEFSVIVVGVLVALWADRWNEARSASEIEAAFLVRMVEEIRQDSARAEGYLAAVPVAIAARDSMLAFLEGAPAPSDLTQTIARSFVQPDLGTPLAWTEVQATASLNLIRDPQTREALSRYYSVDRPNVVLNLERADRRGRDPFLDAMYRIGWIQPTGRGNERHPTDSIAFRDWPGMRGLLVALGSSHGVQSTFTLRLITFSGDLLSVLRRNGPAADP